MQHNLLTQRMQEWIDEFGRVGDGDTSMRLRFLNSKTGGTRLVVEDDLVEQDSKEVAALPEDTKGDAEPSEGLRSRVEARRKYMQSFTEFLKDKLRHEGGGIEVAAIS